MSEMGGCWVTERRGDVVKHSLHSPSERGSGFSLHQFLPGRNADLVFTEVPSSKDVGNLDF